MQEQNTLFRESAISLELKKTQEYLLEHPKSSPNGKSAYIMKYGHETDYFS